MREEGRPFFGICVGMQLMATRGLEHVTTAGLDWIAGDVKAIRPSDPALKIPIWAGTPEQRRAHPLLDGIATGRDGLHAYFVHSYAALARRPRRPRGKRRLRRRGDGARRPRTTWRARNFTPRKARLSASRSLPIS